jgi:hypothetical protein
MQLYGLFPKYAKIYKIKCTYHDGYQNVILLAVQLTFTVVGLIDKILFYDAFEKMHFIHKFGLLDDLQSLPL